MHPEIPSAWVDAAVAQIIQVTLLAAVVGIVVRLAARQSPHVAYLLWMLVVVKCLTPPIAASSTSLFSWAWAEWAAPAIAQEEAASQRPEIRPPWPMPEMLELDDELLEAEPAPPVRPAAVPAVEQNAELSPMTVMFAAWALGAALCGTLVVLKWVRFRRRVCAARVATPDWLGKRVSQLARQAALWRVPRVIVSGAGQGPLSMGVVWPAVVVPSAMVGERDDGKLDFVLAHELLHVKRGDVWANHLQLVAQILWWFHPLVWWANREARRERELCCDEAVLALLAVKPADYAQALIDALELRRRLRLSQLLPIAGATAMHARRLRHLMRPAAKFHQRTPRWCWALVACAAALCLPGAGLSLESQGDSDVPNSAADDNAQSGADSVETVIAPSSEEDADRSANGPEWDESSIELEMETSLDVAGVTDAEPAAVPEFSERHQAAVERLEALGATYAASTLFETGEPYVVISIAENWTGGVEGWRLLLELDVVSYIDANVKPGGEDGLDVLPELEGLRSLIVTPATAAVIEKIGRVTGLRYLVLHDRPADREKLTPEEFAPIGNLANLTNLSLDEVAIDDGAMRHVGRLTKLAQLMMQRMNITDEGITALAELENLTNLILAGSFGSDEAQVMHVTGSGLAALAELPRLKFVSLDGPMVADAGLAGVGQLVRLEQLFISETPDVTAEGLAHLSGLTELKQLVLSGPKLAGDDFQPIAAMKNLRSLIVYGDADLGDDGLAHVAGLTRLRQLDIPGSSISELGMQDIAQLKELRALSIPRTPVTQDMLELLSGLREMMTLEFDARLLDDRCVDELLELPRLSHVSLEGAKLTDAGLRKLVADDRFGYLNLNRTKVTDDGMAALASLKQLEELYLADTAITDAGLAQLHPLKQLKTLSISNTQVTEAGVEAAAAALPNLDTFWHSFLSVTDYGATITLEDDLAAEILNDESAEEAENVEP